MLFVTTPGDGIVYTRTIINMYMELLHKEIEIIILSSDTTSDSDLKQRREFISTTTNTTNTTSTNTTSTNTNTSTNTSSNTNNDSSTNNTSTTITNNVLKWYNQGPVRAAIYGRQLILDGIHTVDRNVLPTLNNLLENREFNLNDGYVGLLFS
jgi:midasin (ATPase involved in ribosome maturation)